MTLGAVVNDIRLRCDAFDDARVVVAVVAKDGDVVTEFAGHELDDINERKLLAFDG